MESGGRDAEDYADNTSHAIDYHLESMYGSNEDKTAATSSILSLCKESSNLEIIVQHHPILSALSRVLSDESVCSAHLTFHLGQIFLAISNFEELQSYLSDYRVGSLVMSAIELEIRRSEHVEYDADIKSQDEEIKRGTKIMRRRRDNILFVCLSVLVRLSDNLNVARKMLKKGLVPMLMKCLQRRSQRCLQTVVILLKRVSIFEEAICEIDKNSESIRILVSFLFSSDQQLIKSSMGVLFNLSFSKHCRSRMLNAHVFHSFVSLLKNSSTRAVSLRLIYHLSTEKEKIKCLWTSGHFVATIMQLILSFPQKRVAKELGALAINASIEPLCAEEMISYIGKLMSRVAEYEDVFLAKVVRNLSIWTRNLQISIEQTLMHKNIIYVSKYARDPSRFIHYTLSGTQDDSERDTHQKSLGWFSKYASCKIWNNCINQIITICTLSNNDDLVLEMVGTLSQMTCSDMPLQMRWDTFIIEHSITSSIQKWTMPGMNQIDLIMEVIMLSNHMCVCEDCAHLISASGTINSLLGVLVDYVEDKEVLLQVLVTCQTFLVFEKTRNVLLLETSAIQLMFDCFNTSNRALYYASERCLDLVLFYDRDKYGQLNKIAAIARERLFHGYNEAWLDN